MLMKVFLGAGLGMPKRLIAKDVIVPLSCWRNAYKKVFISTFSKQEGILVDSRTESTQTRLVSVGKRIVFVSFVNFAKSWSRVQYRALKISLADAKGTSTLKEGTWSDHVKDDTKLSAAIPNSLTTKLNGVGNKV